MEGLEIAEVNLQNLEFSSRIDSEYYRPAHLAAEKIVRNREGRALHSVVDFLIGPFGSAFAVENFTDEKTFRYIRGKDVKPMRLESSDSVYMPRADYERLSKFALRSGDILVSVVGTLGNSALVEDEHLPAIFSCKSTVLRCNKVNPEYLLAYLNSRYGRSLLLRKERGAIQKGLNLDDLKSLSVFIGSEKFQGEVARIYKLSRIAEIASATNISETEKTLLDSLGFNAWTPPETLSYVRSSQDAFAAGRLDAQFFAPRVTGLLECLGRDGLRIRDVAPVRRERFEPAGTGSFNYIEIGSLGADGTAAADEVPMAGAPSRATQHVHAGDVITSTVRPIRRLTALIAPEQDGAVCSSGFVVLEPQKISGEVLLTYLRLPVVCELMDLHTSATMYPAISEADLLALPIPEIPLAVQQRVQSAVRQSYEARRQANRFLEAAKRAVEIAIEDSEARALEYLSEFV